MKSVDFWPNSNLVISRNVENCLKVSGYMFTNVPINPLTPNDPYRGRTAPLTSKVSFYIFIQQI